MNLEHLDCRLVSGEVGTAAGGKVGVIGLAAERGKKHMQFAELNRFYAVAQKQEITPAALDHHHFGVPQGGKMGRRFAPESESGGHKAWIGEIGTVIGSDLDLACEVVFQHGMDIAAAVRPIGADEIDANGRDSDEGDCNNEEPTPSVAPRRSSGTFPRTRT